MDEPPLWFLAALGLHCCSGHSAGFGFSHLTTNNTGPGHVNSQCCLCYLGDVDVVRVMLGRRDHESDAFVQLDACQRRDPHVEEDTEEDGQRDEAEHVCHHYGHT